MMDTVELNRIYPNPDQPRKFFDPVRLEELAQSIRVSGLMEPLIVVARGDGFMIVAGERRWRACKIAGQTQVPIRIIEADEKKIAELSLLENLQREDLNVMEIANAYKGLIDMGMTEEEIAQKMGHRHVWLVSERLSLLNLKKTFQEYAVKGILSPAQALQLSRLPPDMQDQVFDRISSGKINTHEKLKSLVNAILFTREQSSFIPEPTAQEREVNNKYDRMIEQIVKFINRCFNSDDMSVLSAVLTPAAKVNIEQIDMIIQHLTKIKRALLQADSKREVLQGKIEVA
ncbi:MAG: ParB/RepB/Spo0J family partition protein [Candidatus Aminicenantes bacterium]|nr:ParB/RepB/Spo0J family partition protein [Candidatus Aminicenantes bacterium]